MRGDGQKIRIAYYDWDSLMQEDMLYSLEQADCEVVRFQGKMEHYGKDERFSEAFRKFLKEQKPDACFSFNFFPLISDVCQQEGIRYLSWSFDSPLLNLYSDAAGNSCNRIFHFDRGICERMQREGMKNLYHLPLAVRTDRPAGQRSGVLASFAGADISFVGRIYDKKNFYDQIQYLPEWLKGYLEGLMEAQKQVWGYNFQEECIQRKGLEEICRYVKMEQPSDFHYTPAFVFANLFLNQKITAMERDEALWRLAQIADVSLYSDSFPESLAKTGRIHYGGVVENTMEAPVVYRGSRINLNMTLRSIVTGIPLRVFEIAAAGGFVLSNYQEELCECFEPEKEIVLFGSMEEMEDKARYFLEHEDERKRIAEAGRKRMEAEHTLQRRIETIFSLAL